MPAVESSIGISLNRSVESPIRFMLSCKCAMLVRTPAMVVPPDEEEGPFFRGSRLQLMVEGMILPRNGLLRNNRRRLWAWRRWYRSINWISTSEGWSLASNRVIYCFMFSACGFSCRRYWRRWYFWRNRCSAGVCVSLGFCSIQAAYSSIDDCGSCHNRPRRPTSEFRRKRNLGWRLSRSCGCCCLWWWWLWWLPSLLLFCATVVQAMDASKLNEDVVSFMILQVLE